MAEEAFAAGMVAKGWRLSAEAANEKLRERELARGIGEGRAKARRRMERFLAWLKANRCCYDGRQHCKQYIAPEPAIIDSARVSEGMVGSGPWWVAEKMGSFDWYHALEMAVVDDVRKRQNRDGGYDTMAAVTSDMVKSTEWRYLPWQRDPEVAGG